MSIDPKDIEVRMPARASAPAQNTTQTAQEEVSFSLDWRLVGLIVFAVGVGILSWHAHGFFIHPSYKKATAEIENRFGSDVASAFEESNRACPDDVNLTKACALLIKEIKKPKQKIATAEEQAGSNVQVPD